ncbi:MAG TPA: (d)CMP kinase [bacterium]|nr:(d)CMP kinase [bacterium]
MKNKIVIAIDGPAGSGKSTIAKKIADILGILYIDSGAMYRAVTLKCLKSDINLDNPQEIIDVCKKTKIDLKQNNGILEVFVDSENVTENIRLREVTNNVFKIAREPKVREILVAQQQEFAKTSSVIMDGRDIGTVVFPNADLKIYLDASVEERTRRRIKELEAKNEQVDFEKLKEEIIERDRQDKMREVGPLKIADDAIVVDTTGLSINEVINKILEILNSQLSHKKK